MDRVIPAQLVYDEWEPVWGRTGDDTQVPFLAVAPEDAPFLHAVINTKYDINPESMLRDISTVPKVWAVVFFTHEIDDVTGLMTARGDHKDHIGFAAYTEDRSQNPPTFGAMVISDAEVLRTISDRHPVLKRAWAKLFDLPRDEPWVLILDTSSANG